MLPVNCQPPPHAHRFRSDDVAEVKAVVHDDAPEHSRVADPRQALGFEMAWVGGRQARLGWFHYGSPQTLRGSTVHPCLHLPVDIRMRYQTGRQVFDAGPGAAVFVAENAEFSRRNSPGAAISIEIRREALAAELAARHPDRAHGWPQHPRLLAPLSAARRAWLAQALQDFVAATAPDAPPDTLAASEARLVAALADLADPGPDKHSAGAALSTQRLQGLEAWIDEHLAEPLTLGSLCTAAGVGQRTLQTAFMDRRGMSPMRFVAERRLAAAHRRLVQSAPGDDVTRIAVAAGFSHLGRFAAMYRGAYGETPSSTLRRSREEA
jgi:AraC-like DNA-binding protein